MSATSRRKGATYERTVANWLSERLGTQFRRRVEQWQTGGDDLDHEIPWLSIECKNQASTSLGSWIDQTVESAGSRIGIVIHHRRGNGDPGRDFVTMELRDFAALVEVAILAHAAVGCLNVEVER